MSPPYKKRPLLDPETLALGARELALLAKQAHVSVALIGGYALQFFGSPRLTGDLDVVVAAQVPAGLPHLGDLSFGGWQTVTPGGVPTDVIVRQDEYQSLYQEALEAAVSDPVLPLPVVPIEYLAAMKLATRRTKDAADLEWIIAESIVDIVRARAIVFKHLGPFAAREFTSVVDEVLWKKAQGKL